MTVINIVIYSTIFIATSPIISTAIKESRIADLTCLEACYIEQHRYCKRPPSSCGSCLSSFKEVNGNCLDIESANKGNIEETVKDLSIESHPESHVHMKLDSRQEINVASSPASQSVGEVYYDSSNDVIFIAVIVCCTLAVVIGIVIAFICWYRLSRTHKAPSDFDYVGEYGSTNYSSFYPTYYGGSSGSGDRKMAQSAQMFHYQHQKQQMLEMEKNNQEMVKTNSNSTSDAENEEEYTVYEYPGLAPAGEIVVPNPLFMEQVAPPVNRTPSISSNGIPTKLDH
jgi:hypothetical protein